MSVQATVSVDPRDFHKEIVFEMESVEVLLDVEHCHVRETAKPYKAFPPKGST